MLITKEHIVLDAIDRNVETNMLNRFKNLQQDSYEEIETDLSLVLYLVKNTIDLAHAQNIAKTYNKQAAKQHAGFIFIDRKRNKVWDGNHRLYAYYLTGKQQVPIINLYE
ncbi:MAG: hypothetical protein EBX50_15700 [Chitinophagia bacterium]|nr:hypothetical protein [Chitinophagia bacterium]